MFRWIQLSSLTLIIIDTLTKHTKSRKHPLFTEIEQRLEDTILWKSVHESTMK